MAAAKKNAKAALEFGLVEAVLESLPGKRLHKMTCLVQVDLVWPRTGVARKTAAREAVFKRGTARFDADPWTKRTLFREEVEGRCGVAVSVTEPVTAQKVRRFLRLTAKYALKMGADFMEKAMVGYADIASSPIDALAAMIGEKDVPKTIARGVFDLESLPVEGETVEIAVPLVSPLASKAAGRLVLSVKG